MGLTGTKIGCDTSQCGSCVVMLDGVAVKSCSCLAVQVDGSNVTTIEGLAQDGELHAVQEAFWDNHGLQCGFCTAGMIMSVVDLLNKNPHPSAQEVRDGLEGNICRCTGYHNIVKATLGRRRCDGRVGYDDPAFWFRYQTSGGPPADNRRIHLYRRH